MAIGLKQAAKEVKKARVRDRAPVRKDGLMSLGALPKAKRNEKMEKAWQAMLKDPPVNYSDHNNWNTSPADVRPSGFPFCPRKYVMMRLGLYMPDDFDVEACIYTGIGTAVHATIQNTFARTGRLWGFWSCSRPTCKEMLSKHPDFYPFDIRCKHCKSPTFNYEELKLDDPEIGLKGHTDGVLVYKDHCMILEVKTSSDDKVKDLREMSAEDISIKLQEEAPWYGYNHQASTYATLLRVKYPELPPVRGVVFLIQSRDTPSNMASFDVAVPEDGHWYAEIKRRVLRAKKARDLKILPHGFADTVEEIKVLPSCIYCQYKEVCFTAKNLIPDLVGDERDDSELTKLIDA